MRFIVGAILFATAWLLWSGHYTPLLLFLGLLSCSLVMLLAARIGFFEVELFALQIGPRLPRFWFWLLKEIVKANFTVAKIILSPRLPIEPVIVSLDARHLPPVTQVALANSITLTPGTVSLDINRGMIEVHCLTGHSANELKAGEMLRRAERLS